jgi:hexosaminidase
MNLLPRPRRLDLGPRLVTPLPPTVSISAQLPAQGYRLNISEHAVLVEATDAAGAFYAQRTLDQLAAAHHGRLPIGSVEDWPDLAVRGVMIDISRDKVPTMATLRQLIDRLASWKINQVQLYTEHTFAYRDHAVVWERASPVTAPEIIELDAFCRARHVELVPNQNCLGHWDRWLRHDRYRPLALCPDGYEQRGRHRPPSTLDPTNPAALALVRSLLAELLPNFSSRRVHVGMDEPWELPPSRIDDYLHWLAELRAVTELDGREMLVWGDILDGQPAALAALPADVTICEWWYEAGFDWSARVAPHASAERPFLVCPGTSSWTTILGRWTNAVANITEATSAAVHHGGAGILTTDWGDLGHLQYLPISEPGLAWSAAASWCLEANRDLDLPAALDLHCYGDPAGVLGRTLRELGDAHLRIGPQWFNLSTLVMHLYYPQVQLGRSFTAGLTMDELDVAEGVLADTSRQLSTARPTRADGPLVVEELQAASALVALLCRDGRARLSGDGWLASVPAAARLAMADELAPMIEHHRALWLARNRPGGLDDSCAWLANLERCYRTGETDRRWGGF